MREGEEGGVGRGGRGEGREVRGEGRGEGRKSGEGRACWGQGWSGVRGGQPREGR